MLLLNTSERGVSEGLPQRGLLSLAKSTGCFCSCGEEKGSRGIEEFLSDLF